MIGGPKNFALRLLLIAVFLAVWEAFVRLLEIPLFILPTPSSVFVALYRGFASSLYIDHIWVTLAETLMQGGIRLASGGTDNHLMLCDVTAIGLTGKKRTVLSGQSIGFRWSTNRRIVLKNGRVWPRFFMGPEIPTRETAMKIFSQMNYGPNVDYRSVPEATDILGPGPVNRRRRRRMRY